MKFVVFDEMDFGLDVDVLKIVLEGVNCVKEVIGFGVLLIIYYMCIFCYICFDFVYVVVVGKIVEEGGFEFVDWFENEGYDCFFDFVVFIEV